MSPRPTWSADRWCNARLSDEGLAVLDEVAEQAQVARVDVLDVLLRALPSELIVEHLVEHRHRTEGAAKLMRRFR